MKNSAVLSFGSDPEFMLLDAQGRYKSAIGIIKGGKENKVDLGGGAQVFYDNVLMELNIPVSRSEEEALATFRKVFKTVTNLIYPFRMKPQASVVYPVSEVKHPHALVFGCDPEYDAYTLEQMNPPVCEEGNSFRSAGGHIHLGYDKEEYPLLAKIKSDGDRSDRDWGRIYVLRMMDLFIGIPSLLIDHDPTSAARRKLYGKAGSHRPKEEYGLEYRATSNFWLQTPKLTSLIYKLSQFTVNFVKERRHEKMWKDNECVAYNVNDLCDTINNSNLQRAKYYMETLVKPNLSKDLYTNIFQFTEPKQYNFYDEWQI